MTILMTSKSSFVLSLKPHKTMEIDKGSWSRRNFNGSLNVLPLFPKNMPMVLISGWRTIIFKIESLLKSSTLTKHGANFIRYVLWFVNQLLSYPTDAPTSSLLNYKIVVIKTKETPILYMFVYALTVST